MQSVISPGGTGGGWAESCAATSPLPLSGDRPGGRVRAPGRHGFRPPVPLRKLRPRAGARRAGAAGPGALALGASTCPGRGGWGRRAARRPGAGWGGPSQRAARLPGPCPAWRVRRPGARAAGLGGPAGGRGFRAPGPRAEPAEPLGAAARRCARAPAFPAARPAPPAAPPRLAPAAGKVARTAGGGRGQRSPQPPLGAGVSLIP